MLINLVHESSTSDQNKNLIYDIVSDMIDELHVPKKMRGDAFFYFTMSEEGKESVVKRINTLYKLTAKSVKLSNEDVVFFNGFEFIEDENLVTFMLKR